MHSILSQAPQHAESAEPRVLDRIDEHGLGLCIWRRSPDSGVRRVLDALMAAEQAIELDLNSPSINEMEEGIVAVVCPAGRSGMRALITSAKCLASDVLHLASLFGRLAGTEHPRVRLERVEDDGCALFHVDTLRVRMLCVYRGPGTQWLEESNSDRTQLGLRGRTIPEANRAIVLDASAIRSIPTWHVALFKGRGWAGSESHALIHRSAPVRHRGEFRLRLCIDTPCGCGC